MSVAVSIGRLTSALEKSGDVCCAVEDENATSAIVATTAIFIEQVELVESQKYGWAAKRKQE